MATQMTSVNPQSAGNGEAGQQSQPIQQVVVVHQVVQSPFNTPDQMNSQMHQNGGYGQRIALYVLWGICLAAGAIGLVYTLIVMIQVSSSYYYSSGWALIVFLVAGLPTLLEIVLISCTIWGLTKWNYCWCIFSCVWSGIHMVIGLIYALATIMWGGWWLLLGAALFGAIFGLSISLTIKIGAVRKGAMQVVVQQPVAQQVWS
mmetsp:Transcript_20732/g.33026  ORF Transcript_20732/g.33026 Transcript_20732/m.33026 type:complete len:203 (+) Transcript_20732:153-761(+)